MSAVPQLVDRPTVPGLYWLRAKGEGCIPVRVTAIRDYSISVQPIESENADLEERDVRDSDGPHQWWTAPDPSDPDAGVAIQPAMSHASHRHRHTPDGGHSDGYSLCGTCGLKIVEEWVAIESPQALT